MPFAPSQRGLDGLDYAPAPQAPPLGEAQPILGPSHGVLHGTPDPWFSGPSDAPQLDMWDRLRLAASAVRWTEFDRQSKCLHTRMVKPGEPVALVRDESGRAHLRGVVRCGHMTCPACGIRRARDAAARLGTVFERHLAPDVEGLTTAHDAWMLTATIPHYASSSVEDLVDVLYAAWAVFKRSRAWRRFAVRWGIRSTVRVLDVTFSRRSHGPHPHFHVALLPTRARKRCAWTDEDVAGRIVRAVSPGIDVDGDEYATRVDELVHKPLRDFDDDERAEFLRALRVGLMPAWETAVLSVGGVVKNLGAFRDHGLVLTPGERAPAYFTSWGFADEVTMTNAKRETHLALLDRAGAGDRHALDVYLVWRRAVEGHAWVTGMADTMTAVGVTDDDVSAWVAERERKRCVVEEQAGRPVQSFAALRVEIPSYLWFEALTVGLGKLVGVVERAADEAEARAEVLALLLSSSTPRRIASTASSARPAAARAAPS